MKKMSEIKKKINNSKRSYKRRSTQRNFEILESIEAEYKAAVEEEKNKWIEMLCDKIKGSY